jgi:hypothetical protein
MRNFKQGDIIYYFTTTTTNGTNYDKAIAGEFDINHIKLAKDYFKKESHNEKEFPHPIYKNKISAINALFKALKINQKKEEQINKIVSK